MGTVASVWAMLSVVGLADAPAVAAAPPVITQRDLVTGWCADDGKADYERCVAYIAGVKGAWDYLAPAGSRRSRLRPVCGRAGYDARQLATATLAEMSSHPERDPMAAPQAIVAALKGARPCRHQDS